MKKMNTLVIGLMIWAGCLSSLAWADARSFQASVNALAAQSHSARAACMNYRNQLLTADRFGTATFKNKATALAMLARLARYPGTPAAASRAYAVAIGQLPSGVNWSWFMRTYESMQGPCAIAQSYTAMNQLINTTRIARFSARERGQIRAAALTFISKNVNELAPLSVGLFQLSLFQNLIAAKLIRLDARSASALNALVKQCDQVKNNLAARVLHRPKPTDQERATDLIYELKSANWLRARFIPIFKRAT